MRDLYLEKFKRVPSGSPVLLGHVFYQIQNRTGVLRTVRDWINTTNKECNQKPIGFNEMKLLYEKYRKRNYDSSEMELMEPISRILNSDTTPCTADSEIPSPVLRYPVIPFAGIPYPSGFPYSATSYPSGFPYSANSYPSGFPYSATPYPGMAYSATPYPGMAYSATPYRSGFPYSAGPYSATPYPAISYPVGIPYSAIQYSGMPYPGIPYPTPTTSMGTAQATLNPHLAEIAVLRARSQSIVAPELYQKKFESEKRRNARDNVRINLTTKIFDSETELNEKSSEV